MEEIQNLKQIELFLCDNRKEKIKNINLIINDYRSINNNNSKKVLNKFFHLLLEYLTNNIDVQKNKEIILDSIFILLELSLIFPEIINQHFSNLITIIQNYKTIENINNNINTIINTGLLISTITYNIKQINQILSNFILAINNILIKIELDKLNEISNLLKRTLLISILAIISENTNTYNPILICQIISCLKIIKLNAFNYSNNINQENKLIIELFNKKENNENFIKTISLNKLLNVVESQMKVFSEDLNFDNIFNPIVELIKNYENTENILNFYLKQKEKIILKKNIPMTFMKLLKKAIPCLDPEYDLLGYHKKTNDEMTKIIKKKTLSTRKQVIRNLKKEARVIDNQRQLHFKRDLNKKKEEQELTNQFIEQTNLESKKLVTEQGKKRFKLKGKRGKTNK